LFVYGVRSALLLLLCFGGWRNLLATGLPNYYTHFWQMGDQGLPENNVTTVVQTRDGYIWLGTRSGLARFDGVAFTVFNSSTTPEMRSSHVTSLFEADDGALWIGYHDGSVMKYQHGIFSSVQVPVQMHSGRIITLCSDAAGDVWVLNQNGELGRFRDGFVIPFPSTKTVHLLAVSKNPKGGFWVQRDEHVDLMVDGRLQSLFGGDGTSTNGYVHGICATRDGGLWVALDRQMRKWKDGKWTEDFGPVPWDWVPSYDTIETKAGYLAVATADHGLYLVAPGQWALQFCRTNGFSSDWINSMCEDREGNLWVGTGNGGLAILRVVNFRTFSPPDQWQGRAVLSVEAGKDGSLWAGTEGAGLYRFHNDNWTNYINTSGLLHYYVWSVAPDAPGGVQVGTWGGGVFQMKNGRFETNAGLDNFYVAALHPARDGGTYVGTSEGLLHYKAGEVTWLARKPELFLPDVRTICESPDGTIWFGMSGGGLGCLHHAKLRQFRRSDGLSSDFVQCLHLEADGALWIGTFGGGLDRFKNGQFVALGRQQGLPDDVICDIQDDGLGFLWISSHRGIFRLSKSELAACADGRVNRLNPLSFGLSDGLPSLECSGGSQPASCQTADGVLWFATAKGLVGVDPGIIATNPSPPPVLIEEVRVDDQPVKNAAIATNVLEIAPGRHRLEFDYAGLSFVAPERVRFKCRLDGLDHEWVDSGEKRLANYSYIPPGKYVFRVIARNNDGVWNDDGASLAFVVLPFFWQTWWFRMFAILSATLTVGGSVLIVTRRRMRLKLDRLERVQAIERERARIAKDIHDDLGASLTRITMLSQSARGELSTSPEAAIVHVDQIYSTARTLTRAMDEIVWAVDPEHDSLDSLAIYLGKFAQDYLLAAEIRCRLNMPQELPLWAVSADVRHNLFLAFKETLHNVVKHSGATEVCVTLMLEPRTFVLTVQDNGRGFSPELVSSQSSIELDRIEGGHGLINLKLRLQEMNGRCEIQTTLQVGTVVRFVIPVRTPRDEN
jgi:signal transduction histidine kinase/ligand-binding sensor domain-containing protein